MPLHIASFADLLFEARQQKDSQRLLFVFVAAAAPGAVAADADLDTDNAQSGGLLPLLWLDKATTELVSFDALRTEASRTLPSWDIVFVSSLAGKGGTGPSPTLTAAALQRMVEHIKAGRLRGLVPFDYTGQPLFFA